MSLFQRYIPAKVAKPAKPHSTLATLASLATDTILKNVPVTPLPQWQYEFCVAHAEFNNCCGECPRSIDDCLISKVIDSGGDIDKLRGFEVGQGITTDMVLAEWMATGESADDLFENPTWLICMAE